jgi:hypothetical protein
LRISGEKLETSVKENKQPSSLSAFVHELIETFGKHEKLKPALFIDRHRASTQIPTQRADQKAQESKTNTVTHTDTLEP